MWSVGPLIALYLGTAPQPPGDISLPAAASDSEGLEAYGALPSRLTLEAALGIYREHGYDLLLADAAVLNSVGGLESSAQFANPGVNFSGGAALPGYDPNPPAGPGGGASSLFLSGGINDNALILDSVVVGKRRLRIEVAQAALDSQRMSRVDAERGLVSVFKQQWVGCVAARRQLEANQQILASQQSTLDLVQVRRNAGSASDVDLANQETATFEAAQQVEIATQAYEQAKVALAFLLGIRGKSPAFDIDLSLFDESVPSTAADGTVDALHELAYRHRPDVVAQQLQVRSAQSNIRLTHREVVPDIALGISYTQQGVGQNAVSPPTLSGDISATLPLLYRMEGELTMAQANLRTQQLTLAKMEAQVLNDVDMAYAALGAARRRRTRLETGYLEASKKAAELTKIQYEKGIASLVDYLVAERAYIATVQEHIQSLNDLWIAVYQLEAAVGQEFKS